MMDCEGREGSAAVECGVGARPAEAHLEYRPQEGADCEERRGGI